MGKDCIAIATGVLVTMKPNKDKLLEALCPEMLATDLADYLVRKGVPFRETHHIKTCTQPPCFARYLLSSSGIGGWETGCPEAQERGRKCGGKLERVRAQSRLSRAAAPCS